MAMIRYWSYREFYAQHREHILAAVDRVFTSGRLILGPEVESLERAFASFCGAPYAIGVNSGTDALVLSLRALGIGLGDEVITVANTAVPTVAAIRLTGAVPVFVDVEEDSYLMDVTQVAAKLTARTRAVVPVHLCGHAVDMAPLITLGETRELCVVEDCAQACGARYHGRPVGSFGAAAAFSFYPTKVLGAFGDGGMVVTSTPAIAERVRRLRFYGLDDQGHAEEEGINSRLDEVQAAILRVRLEHLDEAVRRRQQIAQIYREGLDGVGDIGLPAMREECVHSFYIFTVRTAHRDRLMRFLRDEAIETKINYPLPVHLMRGYAFLGLGPGDLPVTERLAKSILSLPLYPELPIDDAARVVAMIRRFFGHT